MTSQGRRSASGGGPRTETEFKWDCPYCGNSRTYRYAESEEQGEEDAVEALRSHIAASNGRGHGQRNEFPADREHTLFEYVCVVNGKR